MQIRNWWAKKNPEIADMILLQHYSAHSEIYDESEKFHFIVKDLEVIVSITVDQCIWSDSESVSSLQTLQGVCREMPTLVDSHFKV